MAKKTEKKTEELEVQTVENKETTKPAVEETTTTPTAEKVLQELEEKIKERQQEETVVPEIKLDEAVQKIADKYKDTSSRLGNIVKNNKENMQEALEKELDTVEKSIEKVEQVLKEAETTIPQETRNFFRNIRDMGSWWNGSNSGL